MTRVVNKDVCARMRVIEPGSPGKRIESPQLHPSLAERGRGVSVESADIRSHHRNAEDIEVQNPCKDQTAS